MNHAVGGGPFRQTLYKVELYNNNHGLPTEWRVSALCRMRLSAPVRYKVEQSEIAPTGSCRPKVLRSRRPYTAIALCHQNLAPRQVTPARISTEIAVSKCSVIAASAFLLSCTRFGIATATEAGVIALVWALVLGKFVFREYSWRHLGRSLADCCVDSALIGFLIAASVPFA